MWLRSAWRYFLFRGNADTLLRASKRVDSVPSICLESVAMPKPQGTTVTTAVRQIRPLPLSQHLRESAYRRDAGVVLARNMIAVLGIYAFGWSAAISVFN